MRIHLEVHEVYVKSETTNWVFVGTCNNAFSAKVLAKLYAKNKKLENFEYKFESFKL